jgi:Aspartate racemase
MWSTKKIASSKETKVGLLATAGTVKSGVYANSLTRYGIDCVKPDSFELQLLMAGIYDGVNAGKYDVGRGCFVDAVVL